MKQFLTIEECNKKITAYAIIIAVASLLLTVSVAIMTCHANNLRENSNQTIQPYEKEVPSTSAS